MWSKIVNERQGHSLKVVRPLTIKRRTFETVVARAGRSLLKCPLLFLSVSLGALPLVTFKCPTAQMCVLWPLQPYLVVHKYAYSDR
jgi:hypothetical protein